MDDLFRIAVSNAAWAAGLALFAAAGSRFCRRRPALVHTLWLLVLLKLVTPPVLNVAPPWAKVPIMDVRSGERTIGTVVPAVEITSSGSSNAGSPAELPVAPTPLPAASTSTPGTWPWRILIALGWLAGAVVWWGFIVVSIVRFRKLLRVCIDAPQSLQDRIMQIATQIGLRTRQLPRAVIVPARTPPFVWASLIGRPRLLLPQELWDRLDESQQNALLAHELAHLKRGDHWVRWLEAIVLGLYWWDPIAWLARRELERTEEESCDAWVVWSQPSAAGSYAEALVATGAFLSNVRHPLPLGASGAGGSVALKRRLALLFSDFTEPSLGRSRSRNLLLLAGACLPLLPVLAAGEQQKSLKGLPREESTISNLTAGLQPEKPLASVDGGSAAGVWRFVRPVVRQLADHITLEPTRLRPAGRFNLKAQVHGTSERMHRAMGRQVEKGDGPSEVDLTKIELSIEEAKAVVKCELARARLRVLEEQLASDREHGSQPLPAQLTELKEAKDALEEATAARDFAGLKRDPAYVPAPLNGTTERLFGSAENFMESGAAFALFASNHVLAADIYVEESTAPRIEQRGVMVRTARRLLCTSR